jgi:hypothetical protein
VKCPLAGLRRVFNFAVLRQYMEESPFPKVPKSGLFYPEKKGLRFFFKEEQMVKIVQASPRLAQADHSGKLLHRSPTG